jgi:hypothetical protein
MKRFLPDQQLCIVNGSMRSPVSLSKQTLAADNLRHQSKGETIIARALKYSVSHFIDCDAVARRLCASLIASSNAADETRKIKNEYNQT